MSSDATKPLAEPDAPGAAPATTEEPAKPVPDSKEGAPASVAPAPAAPAPAESAPSPAPGEGETAKLAETLERVATVAAETKVPEEAKTELPKEEEVEGAIGLHPNDKSATVSVEGADSVYRSAETWEVLSLTKELRDALYEKKYAAPSKIQAEALPIILSRERPNLIGQAKAGSGKTAAFALSMLMRVDPNRYLPQAVCVVPTRELARQVAEETRSLGKFTRVTVMEAIKGSARGPVRDQIMVGTPGTLLGKFRERGSLDPRQVQIFVADEADTMIAEQNGSLAADTMSLRRQCPNAQVLLFSATFPEDVERFAGAIVGRKCVRIKVKTQELSLDNVAQFYFTCNTDQDKFELLCALYGIMNIGQAIIFVNTIATAKDLTNKMRAAGFAVSLLYGRLEPEDRDKVMEDFRKGLTTVLITTNVLARGIDVVQVNVVINYDLPLDERRRADADTYIHRIYRAGRFGRKGTAFNLLLNHPMELQNLDFISRRFGSPIRELPTDDIDAVQKTLKEALGVV